jgi:hypothetical protein
MAKLNKAIKSDTPESLSKWLEGIRNGKQGVKDVAGHTVEYFIRIRKSKEATFPIPNGAYDISIWDNDSRELPQIRYWLSAGTGTYGPHYISLGFCKDAKILNKNDLNSKHKLNRIVRVKLFF